MKSLIEVVNITVGRCYRMIDDYPEIMKLLSPDDYDLIWITAEVWPETLHRKMQGQMSLAESISFDLENCVMERHREIKRVWRQYFRTDIYTLKD